MRLLADENIPLKAIHLLRNKGHDILSISESQLQATDEDILELVEKDVRIVLTFDKDFGQLAFCFNLPASSGIVLFRIPLLSVDYVSPLLFKS